MTWKAWTSIEVALFTLGFLIADIYPPAFIFLASMSICYALNIVDASEAFEGFSNTGVLTVGVLVCTFNILCFYYFSYNINSSLSLKRWN